MAEPLRILLVDDHTIFRQGILFGMTQRSDFLVVGEAKDGLEAIVMAREAKPDIIIMDISMPNCSGLEATRQIKNELPSIKILILTVSDTEDDMFEALKVGADGYLLKNLQARELYQMLHIIAKGEVLLSGSVARKIIDEFSKRTTREQDNSEIKDLLTTRELQVLELITTGITNNEIASALVISEGTVKNHLKSILEKLHLRNRTEAAVYAVRRGLV